VSGPDPRARAHFDEHAWEADLARATPAGRAAASAARREFEKRGIPIGQLRRVNEHGRDGTELANCAKVYLPAPAGRFGMVFNLAIDRDGRPVLAYLAFGVRHHPRGSQSSTVYQLAHERLHGTPPAR
jgi:hypothetical protein